MKGIADSREYRTVTTCPALAANIRSTELKYRHLLVRWSVWEGWMLYSTTTSEKSPRKLPQSVKVGKFAAWKMAWCKNWHFRECDGIKIELGHDLYFMHYGHVWRVGQTCMECLHCTKPVYWGGSLLKSASQSFFCVGNTGHHMDGCLFYFRVELLSM